MISLAQIMVDSSNCALGMSPLFFIKTTIERYADEYQAHLAASARWGSARRKKTPISN